MFKAAMYLLAGLVAVGVGFIHIGWGIAAMIVGGILVTSLLSD